MEDKLARKRQAAALPRVSWAAAMRGRLIHLGTCSLSRPCRPHGPVPRILRCTAVAHARKELGGDESLPDSLQDLEVKPGR